MSALPWLTPIAALLLYLLWRLIQVPRTRQKVDLLQDEKTTPTDPYTAIDLLYNFDYTTEEPIKIRPFKPKYHLTMALENCPLSELIAMDKTYLDRMKLRTSILDAHTKETYQCNEPCTEAVYEIYEWTFGTYLPRRFPTMYRLCSNPDAPSGQVNFLHNIPANEYIPLTPPSASSALYTLGRHIDTDILLLLPSSSAVDGMPIYHLQAYVCCFPSGFKTHEKLGLPLASIHAPVPGYKAKLEKSMDRFFAKMELGKAVRRANWSVTTDDKLFSMGGSHMYEDGRTEASGGNQKTLDVEAEDLEESIEVQRKEVRVEECRLRCERQTLHRLPRTKALVFAFKTFQYTLDEVKSEGSGEELADAVEGLGLGSVPDMAFYKRQVVWGDRVVEFLRS
ncbi:uncharacterized protein LTR77_005438 [Saxophila tyrrhenica]|uniref:Uncharacterized protein n=1 Tax=Saxophila tyrrhenica TaxID=1690608 RepID=A0AAV9PBL0_9PEZI|nr:hypothetical protein LTR77_005438 [Saxophila tyrrhenica]